MCMPNIHASEEVDALRKELKASQELVQKLQGTIGALANRLDSLEESSHQATAANESNFLPQRVNDLEEQVFDLQDSLGDPDRAVVKAFDANKLYIGGLLSQQFTGVFGEEGDAFSFNATQLEILFRADVTDRISFFAAQGFLWETGPEAGVSDPNAASPEFASHSLKTPLILGDVTIAFSDQLALQIGRMVTPHGIINIEHFPPTLLDPRQPMFLRPFAGETLFPNFIAGIHAKGTSSHNGLTYSYNLYSGTRTTGPASSKSGNAINTGGRFALGLADTGFTFGVNAMRGERGDNDTYSLFGADILFDKGPWLWKTEYFRTNESGGDLDREAYYTQPAFRLSDKWTVFYRYDNLDDGNRAWPRDNVDSVEENTIGINFQPMPVTRFRLVLTQRDAEPADSTTAQLSTTISF